MRNSGRSLSGVLAGVILLSNLFINESLAQSYPVKPIRILVGFAAGGATEVTARLVAQKLSEQLAQPMVVETRPGADGAIAAEITAKSTPDGHTLLMLAGSTVVQSALRSSLAYNVMRDFAPVSLVVTGPLVFVIRPSLPVNNVEQLIAYARAQNGKLSYGSDGVAGISHLAGELFKMMAKVDLVHVPYKGGAGSAIGLAGGEVDTVLTSITAAKSFIDSGRIRPIAVSTLKRVSSLPAIPTLNESGLTGYDYSSWQGIVGPAGLPKNIVARLNTTISRAINTPEMRESMIKHGREAETSSPEEFGKFIANQLANNIKLAKSIGLKVE